MHLSDTLPGRILTSGAVVNFVLVLAGCLLGVLLKKGVPEKVKNSLMTGMALCVVYIGITGLFDDNANIIIIIVSMGLGAVIGELCDIDGLVTKIGNRLEAVMGKKQGNVAEGFITATLLFCTGAMTVVGSISSGINGDNATLYSKSVIDGIVAVALTSSLGIGVFFSALSVLVLEGSLTLLAAAVAPVLTDYAVSQMSVIGSLLIIGLSLNMLGLTKIKVMNYMPALVIPIVICLFI